MQHIVQCNIGILPSQFNIIANLLRDHVATAHADRAFIYVPHCTTKYRVLKYTKIENKIFNGDSVHALLYTVRTRSLRTCSVRIAFRQTLLRYTVYEKFVENSRRAKKQLQNKNSKYDWLAIQVSLLSVLSRLGVA